MSAIKWVAVAGVTAAAAWPFAVGQIAQHRVESMVSELQSPDVDVTLRQYQLGYLSSTFTLHIEPKSEEVQALLEQAQMPINWTLHNQVSHGVLGVSVTSNIEQLQLPLVIESYLAPFGEQQVAMKMDEYQTHIADTPVDFSAMEAQVLASADGHIKYQFNLPSVVMTLNDMGDLGFGGITGSGDYQLVDGVPLGDQELRIAEVIATGGNGELAMTDIAMSNQVALDEQQKTLDTRSSLSVAAITKDGNDVGKVDVAMSVGALDFAAYAKVTTMLQQLQGEPAEEDVEAFLAAIKDLVGSGLYVAIDNLDLDIMATRLAGNLRLDLPQVDFDSADFQQQYVAATTGTLKASLDGQMVSHPLVSQQLSQAVQIQFVEKTADGYALDASLQQGNLEFAAGAKAPLMQLLMPVFQAMPTSR